MEKGDIKKLKIGDPIIYGGGDELGLSNFTKGKFYIIVSFYDNHYGVVVEDDCNIRHEVCWNNVENYFLTQDEYKLLHKDVNENTELNERVEHPTHYSYLKKLCGIEVIDITRHMDFDMGNAVKYLLRAGHKSENGYTNKDKTIEDLKKAIFYINDKIKLLNNEV